MEKHSLNLQDGITHQHKGKGLNGRDYKEDQDFRMQITQTAESQKRLPFEDLPVPDNLLGTYHQSHK